MARFQMEISQKGLDEIEGLIEKSGLSSKKEFMNNAITLLNWAIRESEQGHKICSYDEKKDSYRELQMPVLNAAFPAVPTESKRDSEQKENLNG